MVRASRILNSVLNTKAVDYLTKPNATQAAATIAIVSGLSKDAINCYYYVTQSLKNEKIPEEKRKFVAALDLSNGILNVLTQFAIGAPIPKLVNKLFDTKVAKKHFSNESIVKMYKNIKPKVSFDEFEELIMKNKAMAKIGLSVIAALIGTQVIAKRIIVPLISTPMASALKDKLGKKTASPEPKQEAQDSFAVAKDNIPKIQKELPRCFKSNFN